MRGSNPRTFHCTLPILSVQLDFNLVLMMTKSTELAGDCMRKQGGKLSSGKKLELKQQVGVKAGAYLSFKSQPYQLSSPAR